MKASDRSKFIFTFIIGVIAILICGLIASSPQGLKESQQESAEQFSKRLDEEDKVFYKKLDEEDKAFRAHLIRTMNVGNRAILLIGGGKPIDAKTCAEMRVLNLIPDGGVVGGRCKGF